jgi:RNA polymerase sigma-70 factor (ECF subfamily)
VTRRGARVAQSTPFARAPHITDEELLHLLQYGDREAVGRLFDRYARLVFGIAMRMLRDRGEAEDLVQEVFLELYEKAKAFDPSKGSGRSWLVQMAYRRALDRRSYLARRGLHTGTEMTGPQNALQEGLRFEERIAARLTGEQIHACFDYLTESQRRTLEMYFFEGFNLREISERVCETLENTRHYYYRGLERLRRAAAALALQSGKSVP